MSLSFSLRKWGCFVRTALGCALGWFVGAGAFIWADPVVSPWLERAGSWPGTTRGDAGALATIGTTLVVGTGNGVLSFDVSHPELPQLVADYAIPGGVSELSVMAGLIYAWTGTGGVVLEFSTTGPLQKVGIVPIATWAQTVSAVVSTDRLYSGGLSGNFTLDVSEPRAPKVVSGVVPWGSGTVDVAMSGSVLVGARTDGLISYGTSPPPTLAGSLDVYRLEDPLQPKRVTTVSFASPARSVAMGGDQAFVAVYGEGVLVFDLSAPEAPKRIAQIRPIGGEASRVRCAPGYVFIGEETGGLTVADVSDSNAPRVVAHLDSPGGPARLLIEGQRLYLSGGSGGVTLVDISTPSAPRMISHMATAGYTWNVALDADTAYLADGRAGMRILNVKNPAQPLLVGEYADGAEHQDVRVRGNNVFLASGAAGLTVVDVKDPGHPVKLSVLDTPGTAVGLEVAGNTAFIADLARGLQIVDVSDPTRPSLVGTLDTPDNTYAVDAVGQTAYLADDRTGLIVVDITDLSAPRILAQFDTPGYAYGVRVVDGIAYVADREGGVHVIDVHEPTSPRLLSSHASPGIDSRRGKTWFARGVQLVDRIAYVADWTGGLEVLDLSDPSMPVALGRYLTPGVLASVAVSGDRVFLALGATGIEILSARPAVSGIQLNAGGRIRMTLYAPSRGRHRLETSGDLVEWKLSTPVDLQAFETEWTVDQPASTERGFYRLAPDR